MEYRECVVCKQTKPLTKEHFYIVSIGGFDKTCRKCRNAKARENYRNKREHPNEKQCSICKEWHPLNGFAKGKKCTKCMKQKNKEYYNKNKDRLRKQAIEWHTKQPPGYWKRLKNKRFFRYRAASIIQRMKTKGTKPDFTIDELTKKLASLWKQQIGLCVLTGLKLTKDNSEVDHVRPTSKHNDYSLDNIRWVEKRANRAKWTGTDQEFYKFICEAYDYAKTRYKALEAS